VAKASKAPSLQVGRYVLGGRIAVGGMAEVHLGRLLGPAGFQRTVAVKRLHPHLSGDPTFVTMFLDEVRLAARIQHPNVVDTLDVVVERGEVFLVMEYVHGESLAQLLHAAEDEGRPVPTDVIVAIVCGALRGLHAAHQAKDAEGEPLHIVHRDVSPHNVIVGVDGVARVIDFGVAKASGRGQTTRAGQAKGKLAYMPPEQLRGEDVDRRADVYAAGVVLWEALTGRRLFFADTEPRTMNNVLAGVVEPPSKHVPGLPPSLDRVTLRALDRDRENRFSTAEQMAVALEACMSPASPAKVGDWVATMAAESLEERGRHVAAIERQVHDVDPRQAAPEGERVTMSTLVDIRSAPSASTAPGPRSTRIGWWLLAAAGVGFSLVGFLARSRLDLLAVTPTTSSATNPAASATASPPAESYSSVSSAPTAPSAPSEAPASSAAAPAATAVTQRARGTPGSAHHGTVRPTQPPATAPLPTSPRVRGEEEQGACPVRSYVDQDGILRFTRQCPP
jgi:serine/threonine protein kinase